MIQYQYFHTIRGYVSRMSLDKDAKNYALLEGMFDAVRKNINGNFFTYATVGTSAIFAQATNNDGGMFLKELFCEEVNDVPAKYIDKFESSVANDVMNAERLPDASLPVLGRRVEDFSLAQNLHHIFAKLVDALLYGDKNKQIVIIADNRESAANYVKVLSMLLPLDFMKNVGFCIGSTSIPNEGISYLNENGYAESISVKIWLPEIKGFDFDAYASFYYVFDTVHNRDNYDRELSSVARVIEGLNLANQTKAQSFANSIAPAFRRDGSVDFAAIEKKAVLQLFEMNRNVNVAKDILRMDTSDDPLQVRITVNAIRCLLEENNVQNLSAEDKNTILRIYRTNADVSREIENSLFNFFLTSYETLSSEEKRELVGMIARDHQDGRLQRILDRAIRGNYSDLIDAFEVCIGVFKIRCSNTSYQIFENKDFIEKIIRFFDISRICRKLPTTQYTNGEDFFKVILREPDTQIKNIAAAILMSSACFADVSNDCCIIRINGLRYFINNCAQEPMKKLENIIKIREIVLDIADEIPSLDISNDQRDFIFNNKTGERWLTQLVSTMSIEEVIEADSLVRNRTVGARLYGGLLNAVRVRLLDVNVVRENVKVGTTTFVQYIDFFNTLPQEIQDACLDIQRQLQDLDFAEKINNEFSMYRCDFAYDCYKTLSPEDRDTVIKEGGSAKPFNQITENSEKTKSVESTIKVFGTVANIKQNKSGNLKPVAMWAFGLSVLSSLILILPAIVQVLIHGKFDFTLIVERIGYNLVPACAFIPLGVFAINVISFFLLREGNKIKRANIITLLCAILPLVMFSVGYLMFYFYGLILDIPFLQGFLN